MDGFCLWDLEQGQTQPARPETRSDQGSGVVLADLSKQNPQRNLCLLSEMQAPLKKRQAEID